VNRVLGGSTDQDATRSKLVSAECPEGYTLVSGGAAIPHANDTPGVSLNWSGPYEDHGDQGWWASAQDAEASGRRWVLQVQAICVSGIEDEGGNALPPRVVTPR
jgi:hypothetical protein